jgi:hypothetical protein
MSTALPACWRADDAKAIFVTEALEGNDAIFLATHTPIEGFDVAGSDAGGVEGDDESAILTLLSNPSRQHAFCVVQGEPGSGKSHLIRWLSVNWPASNDIKLLLRRADGSLEAALRQLRERLPAEFAPLFVNLGRVQRASSQGRANIFLSTLANTLEPGHFEVPFPDDTWCSGYCPADLLAHPTIKEKWQAPSRILNLIEGAQGGRKSATASFDLYDILDLARLSAALKKAGPLTRCHELIRRLEREAETIESFQTEGWTADELATEHSGRFETSLKFVAALNRRRNEAIQNVLGVSAQGLKTLFRQVREALAERGQRLVLLLEDITSWEGIDDSLIDVLVFNAAAKGDSDTRPVCPLISVVGVTPHYYEQLPGNYLQRITHEIKLGKSTGGLQDVATLRQNENRLQFVARYLNAVRVGSTALDAWFGNLRDGDEPTPPIRCASCPREAKCFEVFGESGGIGLFPFTAHALDRLYEALKENDNGQTWKTPRGILQAILNPNLTRPDSLAAGTYPGANIESNALRPERQSDKALAPRLEQIVTNKIESPGERARMRRMLTYWANPERANTTIEGSELAFAGARRSVYEAFGLPWIGNDDATTEQAAPPVVTPAPLFNHDPSTPETLVQQPSATAARGGSFGSALPIAPQPKPKSAPKPRRLTQTKSELEQLREEVRNWSAGGEIENASRWNKLLYFLTQGIDARKLGIPLALMKRLVTAEMVKIEGSTSRTLDYLVIPNEPWVRNGLEAYVALKQDVDMDVEDAEFNRRHLASMMRHLEKGVSAYLRRKIPALPDSRPWSSVASFSQVLLVRAYLRGATTVDAPVIDQVRAVLSDESASEADFSARSAPWQDCLNATKSIHTQIRNELREMVSLGLSEGAAGAALTDASELVGAIVRLTGSGMFDPVGPDDHALPEPYRRVHELAAQWNGKRLHLERIELEQVRNRAGALATLLRANDVKTHLARLDRCITNIAAELPGAAPEKVTSWRQAYARITAQLQERGATHVEDLIIKFEEGAIPTAHLQRLCWLSTVPARDLQDLLSLAQTGEQSIEALSVHARDCVREAGGVGSLADIKEIGRKLSTAVSGAVTTESSQ